MMFRGQIRDAEHKRAKLDQLQQVSLFRKSIKMKTGSFFYCLLKGQREIKLLTVNFIEVVHPENQTIKNRKFNYSKICREKSTRIFIYKFLVFWRRLRDKHLNKLVNYSKSKSELIFQPMISRGWGQLQPHHLASHLPLAQFRLLDGSRSHQRCS